MSGKGAPCAPFFCAILRKSRECARSGGLWYPLENHPNCKLSNWIGKGLGKILLVAREAWAYYFNQCVTKAVLIYADLRIPHVKLLSKCWQFS